LTARRDLVLQKALR